MRVLVDSSVWIAYFRGEDKAATLDLLIAENLIVTNDLILAELLPVLRVRKQKKLADLLYEVPRLPWSVNWDEIIALQVTCIQNGMNKVGLSDLMIAQNARQNSAVLYSFDKHFKLICKHFPLTVQS